ncbi:hypothetical protein [Streptomyces sp. NPDC056190]|uniref:hypothetical protein n=1 Tax=unclassified Streptomyces TaxID=2593676 RepID=UPI0035D69B40
MKRVLVVDDDATVSDEEDRILGLAVGADDYVRPPAVDTTARRATRIGTNSP